MTRKPHLGSLTVRRYSVARVFALCLCGFALLLGLWVDVAANVPQASHVSAMTPGTSTGFEVDHSTHSHPCKRGTAMAPSASCTLSGFSTGLPSVGTDQSPPATTGARLVLSPYAGLAHQW